MMKLLLCTLLSVCGTIHAASPTASSSTPAQQDTASVQQLFALYGALITKGRSGKICRIEPFFYSQGKISNEELMIRCIAYFVWDVATEEPCVSDVVLVVS